jgi:VIT1/CCC1 family predicted Fe2+/Mn2+ transporter
MTAPADSAGTQRTSPTRIPIEARPEDATAVAAELQRRVAEVSRGAARAAVLGVNDGLVTNVCLILAVAGAHASAGSVRLAGFASLIAGAFSMAAGEWVSVRSQVELYEGLIGGLQRLIARNPGVVLDELVARLQEAGLGRATARVASTEVPLDEPRFLRFCSTTLFGIDPQSLGSPLTAAGTSFLLFGLGALVPLLPWFFTSGGAATWLSIAATAAASLAVGGYVAYSSERPIALGALRQLAIVAGASAVTYGIGRLFGSAIG